MPTERTTRRNAPRRGRLWAVVLAGGEGKRLAPLTRALYGIDLPKQFAVISGRLSLLQATIERIAPLVPFERIVVIACKPHEDLARRQLARYPDLDLVIQPRNLDTAPGILLPLARILARDPGARVAIFPSDHYISRAEPFLEAVEAAADLLHPARSRVALLGAMPDRPETDYGWIVPGRRLLPGLEGVSWPSWTVRRFVEKPPERVAERLFAGTALWNTFVSVGQLSAYWDLAKRHLPAHAARFESLAQCWDRNDAGEILRDIYCRMEPANFSRAILECARDLVVVPIVGAEWSDWGTPERVLRTLERIGDSRHLLARIAARESVGLRRVSGMDGRIGPPTIAHDAADSASVELGRGADL